MFIFYAHALYSHTIVDGNHDDVSDGVVMSRILDAS